MLETIFILVIAFVGLFLYTVVSLDKLEERNRDIKNDLVYQLKSLRDSIYPTIYKDAAEKYLKLTEGVNYYYSNELFYFNTEMNCYATINSGRLEYEVQKLEKAIENCCPKKGKKNVTRSKK